MLMRLAALIAILLTMMIGQAGQSAGAQTLPHFDFTKSMDAQEWQAQHDIAQMQAAPDGLHIAIKGVDPYLVGPARDYPAETPLWLRVRLKSEQAGTGQVFYFTDGNGPTEPNSVRFSVRAGKWEEVRIPLPSLGKGTRLRFDPPGSGGTCVLASFTVEARPLLVPPAWLKPTPPVLGPDALTSSIRPALPDTSSSSDRRVCAARRRSDCRHRPHAPARRLSRAGVGKKNGTLGRCQHVRHDDDHQRRR